MCDQDIEMDDDSASNGSTDDTWFGCDSSEIFYGLDKWSLNDCEPVLSSQDHCVLYHLPINNQSTFPPKPHIGPSKWDSNYVRLPSSVKSQYPVLKSNGETILESRWELVQNALLRPILNSYDLEKAILSYNTKYEKLWKFKSLHDLFNNELTDEETYCFFNETLPKIIQLALQLPDIVASAIPLLKQGYNKSISLTQQQIGSLMANAFLCTYPRRNTQKRKSEYSMFPDINFNRLYQSNGQCVVEKIKCLCNYFRRICNNVPSGVITFQRRCIKPTDLPKWDKCNLLIANTKFSINSNGTIEEHGKGLLQVDFANKFIGGGVLGHGCVQEEIRFVICPELIISKLFTEALKPNEALIIIGCEQYNSYDGYASTFKWIGNYVDKTPFDDSKRRKCNIVAIDALHFVQVGHQFREELMLRELNKAYIGFSHTLKTPVQGVASGNWGCGAFGGDPYLKALIQLLACTITKRSLLYFTFNDKLLCTEINKMYQHLCTYKITVSQLWKYLCEFPKHKLANNKLYTFIYQQHNDALKKLNVNNKITTRLEPSSSKSQATTSQNNEKQLLDDFLIKEFLSNENIFNEIKNNDNNSKKAAPTLIESLDEFYNKDKNDLGVVIVNETEYADEEIENSNHNDIEDNLNTNLIDNRDANIVLIKTEKSKSTNTIAPLTAAIKESEEAETTTTKTITKSQKISDYFTKI